MEVLIKVDIRAEIKLSKCDRTPVRLGWTWPPWWPGLMSSAPPQAGWAMLWESQGVCDSPAAWKPHKFSLGRNAEASVSLQMLGPFVQHTLVQPQWEKYISLFQPAVFSSQSSPWILQMWIRAEHILLQNFCIYYTQVFPTSNVFLLAALTECSLVERKGKRTMKGFTCRYLYMSHVSHMHKHLDPVCPLFLTQRTPQLLWIFEQCYYRKLLSNYEEIKVTRE